MIKLPEEIAKWRDEAATKWWTDFPGHPQVNPGRGDSYKAWSDTHQTAYKAGVDDLWDKLSTGESVTDEHEIWELVLKWKGYWMDQTQNSQEDHDNYFRRAYGVDSNMTHHLAKMVTAWCRPREEALLARIKELEEKLVPKEKEVE